jgi:hypothetical protein
MPIPGLVLLPPDQRCYTRQHCCTSYQTAGIAAASTQHALSSYTPTFPAYRAVSLQSSVCLTPKPRRITLRFATVHIQCCTTILRFRPTLLLPPTASCSSRTLQHKTQQPLCAPRTLSRSDLPTAAAAARCSPAPHLPFPKSPAA